MVKNPFTGDPKPGKCDRDTVGNPRAALAAEAAVLVARDTGDDPRHTLHLLFIAASEAAALVRRASIEGTHGARVDASDRALRVVARLVGAELRAGVEALNIAVAALDAFAGERGRE